MINEVPSNSVDITEQNIDKLKELFPEILTDGNKIDFDKLQLILGEEIDGEKERYSFNWPGKREAIIGAQQPSKGTLRPNLEKSKNFETTENLYIEGDNLEVLKLLQKSYNNKIKVIYIDPPYNTGKDFVYKDNFRDGVNNYLEQTGQVDSEGNLLSTNSESNGRFHTDWLNMMYPRLKLARNLLTDDGVIFISINDNELANIKKISDEIFSERNFIENYIWESTFRPDNSSKITRKNAEYILCYAKNIQNIEQLKGTVTKSEGLPSLTKNSMKESELFFKGNVVQTFLADGKYSKGTKKSGYTLTTDVKVKDGMIINDFSLIGRVIWGQKYLDEQLELGTQIIIKNDSFVPYSKKLSETILAPNKIIPKTQVADVLKGRAEVSKIFDSMNIFSYPKPVSLLSYLIDILNDKDSTILDFFSGSASTAHAVLKLNSLDNGRRKFIMVQIPEVLEHNSDGNKAGFQTISDIGSERIRRTGEKIILENPDMLESLDIGFKYLTLDKSNIREWNTDFESIENELDLFADVFVEGRSELDIVYEIMLKNGLELTLPIDEFEVNGKKIYDIAFGHQFICLSENIDTNIALAIIDKRDEYGPEITSGVVFKDSGFSGNDSEKLNCIQLLKDAGFIEANLQTI